MSNESKYIYAPNSDRFDGVSLSANAEVLASPIPEALVKRAMEQSSHTQGYEWNAQAASDDQYDDGLVHSHNWASTHRSTKTTDSAQTTQPRAAAMRITQSVVKAAVEIRTADDQYDDGLVHSHNWARTPMQQRPETTRTYGHTAPAAVEAQHDDGLVHSHNWARSQAPRHTTTGRTEPAQFHAPAKHTRDASHSRVAAARIPEALVKRAMGQFDDTRAYEWSAQAAATEEYDDGLVHSHNWARN